MHLKQKLTSDLIKDILWTFSSQILIMLIVLFVNKLVSSHLGVEGFALYSIAKKSSTVLVAILAWGITIALPRYLSIYRVSNDKRYPTLFPSSLLLFSILSAGLFLICSLFPSTMREWILGGLGDNYILMITLFYSTSSALNNLIVAYFRGKGLYKRSNIVQICTQLSLFIGALFFRDIAPLFLSWSILILLNCILFSAKDFWKDLQKCIVLRGDFSVRTSGKQLLYYGTPRMLSDLIFQLTSFVPLLIVLSKFGETATGLFSTAITLQLMITPLFAFSGQIFLQRVSELLEKKELKKIRHLIRWSMIAFLSIASAGFLIISVGAEFWLQMLFSKDFIPANTLTIIVSLSLIPRSIYLLLRNPLDAISSIPYNLFSLLIWFALYILLLFFSSTIESSAWSYTLSSLSLAITSLIFWIRALHRSQQNN